MSALEVDIWSDVMCPWCAIGLVRYARAIELVAGDAEVTTRFLPFELNPDLPAEGRDHGEHLGEVLGRSPSELAAMQAQLLETARVAGFAMDWAGEGTAPPLRVWNTHAAHCLLRWALEQAGPEAQLRLKQALFAAHFSARRNIADPAVLADIAAAAGLDRAGAEAALADPAISAAVQRDELMGRQSGITAVPTFVINRQYVVQGAQEPDQLARALRHIASMEAGA